MAAAVAATSGAISRARASACANPLVCASMYAGSSAPLLGEVDQQAAEQRRIGAAADLQHQVGVVGRRGAARINDNELGAARALVGDDALIEHRVAPGRIGADQHDQVGGIEILVAARHGVGTERAPMAGDGRRHAEPRVGIDIGRAEKALHQFVGDVIVLGQQLPGEIERDGLGPVAFEDTVELTGHAVERTRPVDAGQRSVALAQHRVQQPSTQTQCFAERRAFRAGAAKIGGVLGIPRNRSHLRDHQAPPTSRIQRRNKDRWCVSTAPGGWSWNS